MSLWAGMTDGERDKIKAFGILAVVILAGAIYYDVGFVTPANESVDKRIVKVREEEKTEQQKLQVMEQQVKDEDKLRARKDLLQKVIDKLPKSPDPTGFFEALESILRITRIEYSEMRPEPQKANDTYTELPYRIVSRARYHDFGQFLNLIEENPKRLMRIKTFSIENQDQRPSIHPVQVQLATFMFNK